ncbi:MAG: YkgJ family cysteine cluster protein [Candidatus Eisenbacteria bacterium]|nr:YkgJ family cysteine cluster protein [Candidatus Eisenbacteria bacterium]
MSVRDSTGERSFRCRRCGACCRRPGYVLLDRADRERLAAALGLDEAVFLARYARVASNRAQLSLIEKEDGSCVFLEGDRCAVYEARPRQCRDYPRLWRTDDDCPGWGG